MDRAQYLVCAVLVAVGAFLVYDALTLPGGYAKVDPVGPKLFPVAIGVGLIVLSVILAIAIPRGSKGRPTRVRTSIPTCPVTGGRSDSWSASSWP